MAEGKEQGIDSEGRQGSERKGGKRYEGSILRVRRQNWKKKEIEKNKEATKGSREDEIPETGKTGAKH